MASVATAATAASIASAAYAPFASALALTLAAPPLAAAAAAAAAAAPAAVSDERGSTLLDRVRTCRPLPIFVWRSGCLLQAGPNHGRSRLRLRREGL